MNRDGGGPTLQPRRWPSLLVVLVRWRLEIASATAGGLLWYVAGGLVVSLLALTAGILVATVPLLRQGGVRAWQLLALPHRVRAALVQAGVVNRYGHLPWVLWARSASENVVRVEIKLRAGITVQDIHNAAPYIAGACAAMEVQAFERRCRPDRVVVFLVRPRWGLR